MKIGIIYCAYNCESFLKESLSSFINLRNQKIISDIAVVSVPFAEYKTINTIEDNTIEILNTELKNSNIDVLYTGPKFIDEASARNLCLDFLKNRNVDFIWIVDGDELYTEQNIIDIIKNIKLNPNFYWYKINFKNYVFDGKRWVDGFCPPRIFRVNSDIIQIHQFYWDNDIVYKSINNNEKLINYKSLSYWEIPKNVAHIKHMTWLHSNSKNKYEYQIQHFGLCGYKWNEETNCIEFNYDFYIKNNQTIPQVYLDE
jgi:hypothetical protein